MPKIKPKLNKLKGHTGALGGVIVAVTGILSLPELAVILPTDTLKYTILISAVLALLSKSLQ
jgi:hypothetical protein